MSTSEIIYLSSEDDDNDQIKTKNVTKVIHSTKNGCNNNTGNTKKRILPLTVGLPKRKRVELISSEKMNIVDADDDGAIEVIGVITTKDPLTLLSSSSTNKCNEQDDDVIISKVLKLEDKPLLVVKEKHPVHATNGRQDIFSMFLSQCLQSDKSTDMRKIVEKLKRKYEQLDPSYAHSEEFENLLNEKRNCLMNESKQIYKNITEVSNVMKVRKLRYNGDSSSSKEANICDNINNEEDSEEIRKKNSKIRAIEKIMLKVEKRIKKYEEAEVDLDDDSDSTFLITERYKRRMVELYGKWCELTGNHKDAERSYLRPIHLKLTGIVTVDQAINSFINSKLDNKKKPQIAPTANNLVFPDYVDILKLIQTHNVNQKLGMDARSERSTAKQAFIKLGEYLKLERQKDFYDTFSSMYDQGDDPAIKHDDLKVKLRKNRELGEKKLNAIFDEYSKKQDRARSLGVDNCDEDSSTDNEEEEAEDKEINGDDKTHIDDIDSISAHESDSTVHQSYSSSDDDDDDDKDGGGGDDVMIDDQDEVKVDNVIKIREVSVGDGIKELKLPEKSNIEEIEEISSFRTVQSGIPKDNISKKSCSDVELKLDDIKTAKTPMSTKTTKANIINDIQAVMEDVVIEPNNVEDTTNILNAEDCGEEKPLLKLRSFAVQPGFWQNYQDSKSGNSNEKSNVAESKPIEIIDLDNFEEQHNNINKKLLTNKKIPHKLVPLASKNKDCKVFRRVVTIPAAKLTNKNNSNIQLSKVSVVNKDAIKQSVITDAQKNRFVPLSAIEIRNKNLVRPIAYIRGERKSSGVSPVEEKQQNTTATNSNASQNLRINPVASNIQILARNGNKPPVILNLKNRPTAVQNTPVKYLELMPQKAVNPIIKQQQQQQQNIENMEIITKVPEYDKNITNPEKSEKLIPR